MTVLVWLVVPLVVTALAAAWVAYAHRTRPPADPRDSMAEHQRFRQAMERPAPKLRQPSPSRDARGEGDPADDQPGEDVGGPGRAVG